MQCAFERMSTMKKIGLTLSEKVITWKINDFFSHSKENSACWSSEFHVLNSIWQIKIYPNGRTINKSTGYVSLYLYRIDNGATKFIEFEFGLKAENDLIEYKIKTTWKAAGSQGMGFHKFIVRTELQRKKLSVLPSGNLTIVCTLNEKLQEDDVGGVISRNKLVADLKDMFISKKNTDVTIKVNEETFSAHRFILTARSPVFGAMFENEMTEKKTGTVDITDCDPKTFGHFLFYLYAGELDSVECDFYHLYEIADKYDVSQLKMVCTDSIINSLCHQTVFETYIFGCQFNENKVLTNVQNFFKKNFEEVLSLDSWEPFMKEHTGLATNLLKVMSPTVADKK